MLAQAAQETLWGKEFLESTNNLYNIKKGYKGRWDGPTVRKNATEVVNGKKVIEPSFFRVYKNIEESVKDRTRYFATNKSYAKIFQEGIKGSLIKEASVLREAKYATDPKYEYNLNEVAQGRTMKKSIKLAREYHGY